MARDGYFTSMFQEAIEQLNLAAEDVAALEPFPLQIELPPEPGVGRRMLDVEGFFNPNPSPQVLKAVGLQQSYNGVLYVRDNQTPEGLTRGTDATVPAGMRIHARGRQYRVVKALYERGLYTFVLNDIETST